MAKDRSDQVYQFKITLRGIKPPIWRRIQVPESCTFWGLHVAIQDAMGWQDYHLHAFGIPDPATRRKATIGIPDGPLDTEFLPSVRLKIADYFSMANRLASYEYDFGDGWLHEIRLEKILPEKEGVGYPICIAGKRACPPEDCGGRCTPQTDVWLELPARPYPAGLRGTPQLNVTLHVIRRKPRKQQPVISCARR